MAQFCMILGSKLPRAAGPVGKLHSLKACTNSAMLTPSLRHPRVLKLPPQVVAYNFSSMCMTHKENAALSDQTVGHHLMQHRIYNYGPLHHKSTLRLHPVSPCISCQRHFSRETLAYYLSSDYPPIGYAQSLLMNMHEMSGLPWWATIMVTTIVLRTVITLPFSIYSAHVLARVEKLGPEISALSKELKMEVRVAVKKYEWDNKVARYHYNSNMKRLIKDLYIRENCHPFKASLVMWFQIPMWISLSLALRNMAGALPVKGAENIVLAPSLASEGLLWIPNLLYPDVTFILPVTIGLVNLAITEMHALRVKDPTKKQRAITNFFRGLSLVMIPIGAIVPSCMCLYWTCSSFYGLGQNVALRMPSVRRACRIPAVPSESETPFRDLYKIAKYRYGRKKKSDDGENS